VENPKVLHLQGGKNGRENENRMASFSSDGKGIASIQTERIGRGVSRSQSRYLGREGKSRNFQMRLCRGEKVWSHLLKTQSTKKDSTGTDKSVP